MRFPVGLNSISFGTLIALPFLFSMFSTEMLLDACKVSQGPGWIMVYTGWFWTQINPLPDFFGRSLPQLPGKIMPTSVKLQILFPLKAFVAYFAHKSVCSHQTAVVNCCCCSTMLWSWSLLPNETNLGEADIMNVFGSVSLALLHPDWTICFFLAFVSVFVFVMIISKTCLLMGFSPSNTVPVFLIHFLSSFFLPNGAYSYSSCSSCPCHAGCLSLWAMGRGHPPVGFSLPTLSSPKYRIFIRIRTKHPSRRP
eukprot:Gb_18891 [translate_table: standard]